MSIRTIGRLGAAVALAVGLLAASAIPASATVHAVAPAHSDRFQIHMVTGGLPSTRLDTVHYSHPTSNVCAPNSTSPAPFSVDFDSTGGGTFGASSTEYIDFPFGTSVKSRMNILGGTVSLSATGITISLTINIEFRNCASTTVLCRTTDLTMTLSGANPTGTHHPSASDVFNVSGTSTPINVQPGCNLVIRTLIVNNLVEGDLDLHVTT